MVLTLFFTRQFSRKLNYNRAYYYVDVDIAFSLRLHFLETDIPTIVKIIAINVTLPTKYTKFIVKYIVFTFF